MADDSFKVKNSLNIQPVAGATPSAEGDIVYDDTANSIKYNNGSTRTVVNTDEAQTLSSKTLTAPVISTISNTGTLTLPTSTDTLVGRATTDTLTNKTLTSPTLTTPSADVITMDGQGSTPSNPSSGYYKMFVSDTTGKLTILDSSGNATAVGGGSGLKNYITYPDAEAGTTGWATYADAAGTRPVDGTGGSPSSTWTTSSTTPLSTNNDFLWTKSAANRQGEGVSYAFTIDRSDQGKPLQIEFNYELVSGTFTGSTTPSTDSDMIVYIYDVTNATLIEPQGRLLEPMVTSMYYRYRGTFQTAINSTSYRLILHTATTSASAYTLAFDDFRVGPQVVSNGAVVTDWKDFSSVAAGTLITATTTNPTYGTVTINKAQWRRVGDSAEIQWDYYQTAAGSGANGSGMYLFNIPAEIGVMDTTKITVDTNDDYTANQSNVGWFRGQLTGVPNVYIFTGIVSPYSSTKLKVTGMNWTQSNNTASTFTSWSSGGGLGVFSQGDFSISLTAKVPIAGWSSNVQMSSDSDTRVVAARYYASSGSSTTANNPSNFDTKEFDTHNAVTTGASWKFTAPVSGYYEVTSEQYWGGPANLSLYKNGSIHSHMATPTAATVGGGSNLVYLNAGDYVDVRPDATASFTSAGSPNSVSTTNWISIKRLSGPSQIAASEEVSAIYTLSANQSLTANTSTVNFDTKVYDSHNCVSTGASSWKFTAPTAGRYNVSTVVASASTSGYYHIYKNGSAHRLYFVTNSTYPMGASALVNLNAGDYIDIRCDATQTATGGNTANGDPYSSISIHRI